MDHMCRMSGAIVMVELKILCCPHVGPLSSHSFTKATKNLQVVLLVNCLAFWFVFVMHDATGIKKTGQHHFYIAVNLPSFFFAVVIPDASIVRIETWFLGRNHKPRSHHQ